MGLIVQKFGGTSVGSVERILNVADKIIETKRKGDDVVVVVSAMGRTTDDLVNLAEQITDQIHSREMDMLLSTGEQVSMSLLAMALSSKGYSAISLTGWQAGIFTESFHSNSRIEHIDVFKILPHIHQGRIVIIAGFQGIAKNDEITTLGRGGSDTTAVALAASLHADLCEIYTDVDGVYTADPRIVKTASKLKSIHFDEMLELASLGAGVLHPRSVKCAKKNKVRLTVRSSFSNEEGTFIGEDVGMEKENIIRGIAHSENVSIIKINHFPIQTFALYSLFSLLMQAHISVDFISQINIDSPQTSISFSVSRDDLKRTLDLLQKIKGKIGFTGVHFEEGLAKISIVGSGLTSDPEVVPKMFKALADSNVYIKMVSTSEIKISCIIPADRMVSVIRTLHSTFGLDSAKIAVVNG